MTELKNVTMPVTGMTCANCATTIERNVRKLAGVNLANVNLASEKLTVAFDPSGSMVASGGKDHSVQIWKSDDGAQLRKLNGHTDFVGNVAWSPDGKRLASTGADGTVMFWGALP